MGRKEKPGWLALRGFAKKTLWATPAR